MLLIDLDGFTGFKDDEVLKLFGGGLKRGVRKIDLPARIGGTEFAILLPQTGSEGARTLAERLRSQLRGEHGLSEGITASFGVAHYPEAGSAEELLLGAVVCLNEEKERGRDQGVLRPSLLPRAQGR